jgi:hypothetical protein
MAGKIIANIIEAPAGRISLNVANVTVASINASGLYTSTGNLLITQANSIATAAIEDGAVTNAKLTLAANASNIKTALNASGDAAIFAARSWVNFNGTGTPAVRASGNVSSLVDNGTGSYTVNFTTAMSDANYSAVVTGAADLLDTSGQKFAIMGVSTFLTTSFNVTVRQADNDGNTFVTADTDQVCLAVFR